MFGKECETKGCTNKSTRLASKNDGSIIGICDNCWHIEYKS